MVYDEGCYGEVLLGALPNQVKRRLSSLPGEWLEFDSASGRIVVRHTEPTSPNLPTITFEVVQMLSAIPGEHQPGITGGDLFVHVEDTGEFVRLHVDPGGALHINWAHPSFARSLKRPYSGGQVSPIDPHVQRLNGRVTFAVDDPVSAARELQTLGDTFEGLYPEGDYRTSGDEATGTVRVDLHDVNLDGQLLVERMQRLAKPRSLTGSVVVSAFGQPQPEHGVRFVFENGEVWVQRPMMWHAR
jgi:hypothetical protein